MSHGETGEKQPLTVGALRALLEGVDASMPVWLEGCDCWGALAGRLMDSDSEGPFLLLCRTDGDEARYDKPIVSESTP